MSGKILKMNPKWCKGCGICVEFCPKGALALEGGKAMLSKPEACILCGQCELRCPDYAIWVEEDRTNG